MAKYFPKRVYWVFVIRGSILNLIFSAVIAIISMSLIDTLLFFTFYQIFLMVIYRVYLDHFAEKVFNKRMKKGLEKGISETEFYDDYFIRKSETITFTIKYSEIARCVETNTNFYFEYPLRNAVMIFQKNRCDLELINFIRKKFNNLENCIGDNSNFNGVKKYHNPSFIKRGMTVLFVITILSLLGALYSITLVNKLNPQNSLNFTKNTWVCWCWLPIPILSVILGFKYEKVGFKCTKNIVGGFIIGFLLLIYGSFCMFPTFSDDYNKINNYKDIIDADLPNNGELQIQDWGTYVEKDKTEYMIINVYYDKEDVSELVNSIESRGSWILSNQIEEELKIFIPSKLYADDDAYYSIYNKTTNQYNVLPENSGEYEIYTMKYDKSDKKLEIHKFEYLYN